MVNIIHEHQIDINRQSSRVWFGRNNAKDIWKYRFTYGPMANMAKIEQDISIVVFICWNAQEVWDMEEA